MHDVDVARVARSKKHILRNQKVSPFPLNPESGRQPCW